MRKGYPISFYKQVAEVYNEAVESRTPGVKASPLKAISETWNVPHSTAAAWVKRARQKGLMPPAEALCSCRCRLHCPPRAARASAR